MCGKTGVSVYTCLQVYRSNVAHYYILATFPIPCSPHPHWRCIFLYPVMSFPIILCLEPSVGSIYPLRLLKWQLFFVWKYTVESDRKDGRERETTCDKSRDLMCCDLNFCLHIFAPRRWTNLSSHFFLTTRFNSCTFQMCSCERNNRFEFPCFKCLHHMCFAKVTNGTNLQHVLTVHQIFGSDTIFGFMIAPWCKCWRNKQRHISEKCMSICGWAVAATFSPLLS